MSASLYTFIHEFYNEERCLDYLIQLKYGSNPICEKCGSARLKKIKSRTSTFFCCACRKQISITKNTVFENSKLSLMQWFIAVYLMSKDKRGISALQLARELNITYNPAMILLIKLRDLMRQRESKYKLMGEIDVDEFYILGSGGKRGRGTDKAKVIIALSYHYPWNEVISGDIDDAFHVDEFGEDITPLNLRQYPAFIKMRVVENLSGNTINNFISDSIEVGSNIRTDNYRSYNKLLETGNTRLIDPSDTETDNYRKLNKIITNVKAYINGTYHGVTKENLQPYLDNVQPVLTYEFFVLNQTLL